MYIDEVYIEGFACFGKTSITGLANRGLVLVDGENYYSESAENNGSGKSSLFEAICWCLFDQTTKKQLADDVISTFVKGGTRVRARIVDPVGACFYDIAR